MELESRFVRARQAGNSWNALSWIAALFLVASLAFWFVLHWTALMVPGAGFPQAVVAVVMTLVYALALPLLLSMLVPTTPAGMLLQKTQWKTVGFPVIVGSALFLGWHARNLIWTWFVSQPVIGPNRVTGEPGQETAYTIACLIAFVVIPALAWVQATPEQWLNQIKQAHLVRKLEMQQRGELAILKARLLWAEQRAALSYAKLLPAERQEIMQTMRGLFMGIADAQRGIARTVGVSADVERALGIPDDQEIADELDYVARELAKPATMIDRALDLQEAWRERRDEAYDAGSRPEAIPASPPPVPAEAPPPRHAAPRRATPRHAAEYQAAREKLSGTWSARQLAGVIGKEERTARDRIAAWEEAGLVAREGKATFYFTESVEV
jgi:hypothetical protein